MLVKVIIRFQFQFLINLHELVFHKAEIARAVFNLQVQINSKFNEKNRMITY